ncbi:FAD-binding oxidoreductase [Protaetiibacter intestinalis]|nr:FAD-linked oxidase C-terminal domain-containing protein [Protaetiibacter intestinalis]
MLEELRAAVGEALVTDAAALEAARGDKSGQRSAAAPLAIVEAREIGHVQAALRWASAHGVPVVPRGAGTGLAGGALAGAGELVLSTSRLDRILEISAADELAVVEAGVINAELNTALAEHGLWYTPDPASRAISTIGGNLATNAGGLMCVKYGVTRESVLGMKVVLADGRLLELGHRTVKGVTGYDLTALMIGSEGTLGVIVEATVRVRPVERGAVVTVSAAFPDVDAAARAAAAITASGVRPAALELLDTGALDAIGAYLGVGLGGGARLLVQTDGGHADAEAARVLAVVEASGGTAELGDAEEGERLFAIRRAFHPAMERQGSVLIEDVAVPRSALPAMFAAIARIEGRYGIRIPTVAHAGDGNLHPNFVYRPVLRDGREEVPEHIWDAAHELFQECLRLGGTLTGEHGVGLLKRRWLRDELGDDGYGLQRQLKAVFDPQGILNPGKVFS